MKELTKAEEQIMQILWELKQAFVHDIIEQLPEPKPAYNTVSTIVRILEKKGFVDHEAFGKTHRYHPVIEKKVYTKFMFKGLLNGYFSNSMHQMVSFFSKEKGLSLAELEELKQIIENEINTKEKN
ncbi:MAG: BlaI/MecI/CopY family transcriptional regulator [Bacteroidales bacterium]|nr:BlaI/MecI/CopY family transcriptional regulator [Bacteroidales bacterium]MDP2237177.1 BlaI/MecI/CopY family transcriptional regulator [Bacteroidales bacterium]